MKKWMLTLAAAAIAVAGRGQRDCASTFNAETVQAADPERYSRFLQLEQFIQDYRNSLANTGTRLINANGIIVIPVVVHILHGGEPPGTGRNISDAQVQSQIDVLNEDFRRLNPDRINTPAPFAAAAADIQLQFRLACTDPNGNPTNGITRRQTTVPAFNENNDIKFTANGGEDAWPTSKYLNIWVSELTGRLLGYAQFPFDFSKKPSTDGIVIKTNAFGRTGNVSAPYNLGRTATHEIGHWLNLYHIWGDDNGDCNGTDYCDDTPNQANFRTACPAFPAISCSNGPNGDMFMNYMDYTDDPCMNLFTNDQRIRMRANFAPGGPREGMIFSTFNIDPLYAPVCNSATIQLSNPACLTGVNWSVSGPATIAGSGSSAVITRTGAQNGLAVVTASADNYTESREFAIGMGANSVNFTAKQIQCVNGRPHFFGAVKDIPYAGITYNWYSKDESNPANPFILRQSGAEYTADFPLGNNRGNRYYTIRVVAVNACGSIQSLNADGYMYAPPCNGGAQTRLAASPNPVSGDVNIRIIPSPEDESDINGIFIHRLEVTDKTGNPVLQKKFTAGVQSCSINLSGLHPDMYILKAWNGSTWLFYQLVKK